jgi:hypothetical protein
MEGGATLLEMGQRLMGHVSRDGDARAVNMDVRDRLLDARAANSEGQVQSVV